MLSSAGLSSPEREGSDMTTRLFAKTLMAAAALVALTPVAGDDPAEAGAIHKTSHMVVQAMNLGPDGVTMAVSGPRLNLSESRGTASARLEHAVLIADMPPGSVYVAESRDQVSSGHTRDFDVQILRDGAVLAALKAEMHINLSGVTRCELKAVNDPNEMLSVSVSREDDGRVRAIRKIAGTGLASVITNRFGPDVWEAIMRGDWVEVAALLVSVLPGEAGVAGKALGTGLEAALGGPKRCNAVLYIHDPKA